MDTARVRGQARAAARITLKDGRRIHGFVSDGYGGVMDTFIANFIERNEVGAACTAFVGGQLVVDLWAGVADARTGRPWDDDTAAVIFSCSKGLLAICAYLLVQEGQLELDRPIADYWPEFADNGKSAITVRQAMSHRAGLPCLDHDFTLEELLGWEPVIRAIERQRPLHLPLDGHIYHAMTYGWLVGEVIRRLTDLKPGQFFRRAVGDRLGLRTWIGLPDAVRASVAWMEPPLADEDSEAARESARCAIEDPIVARSVSMGGALAFPADRGLVTFNSPAIQSAEIPGANGISTARALARLYAGCVSEIEMPALLSKASISDALRLQAAGQQLTGVPDDGARWGTGFQLASPPSQPMIGATSFGHTGAGGQLGFADAAHQVGFAYLSNQMGGYGDARARELTVALRAALGV